MVNMTPPHVPYVDPRCAVCRKPAEASCGCEARALEAAISQAEERYFSPMLMDVRSWVRARARDYILEYYHEISRPCREGYTNHRNVICAAYSANSLDPEPNLRNAERIYHQNVDDAWSLAVMRYPEVLDYFFSLVHISLPDDHDPALHPPPPPPPLPSPPGPCRRAPRRRPDGVDEHSANPRPPFNRIADFRSRSRRVVEPKSAAPVPAFPIPARKLNGQPAVPGRPGWPTPPPSPQTFPQRPQPGPSSMR